MRKVTVIRVRTSWNGRSRRNPQKLDLWTLFDIFTQLQHSKLGRQFQSMPRSSLYLKDLFINSNPVIRRVIISIFSLNCLITS